MKYKPRVAKKKIHPQELPRDPVYKKMQFEKHRKEKIDYRKQMMREWRLGQAQNLHDTYTSMLVRPHELAPAHIRRERDQIKTLLQHHGALRPNFIPN